MGLDGQHHAPDALGPGTKSRTHCTGTWVGLRGGQTGCGIFLPHIGKSKCISSFNNAARPLETFSSYRIFHFVTRQHDITEILISLAPLKRKLLYLGRKLHDFAEIKSLKEVPLDRKISNDISVGYLIFLY
jgi:hypothetical protein